MMFGGGRGRSSFGKRLVPGRDRPSQSELPLLGGAQREVEPQVVARRLPSTPIYASGGPFVKVPRAAGPKLLRDQLYDRLCDWGYHPIEDFEIWLPGNQFVSAMIELVNWGFAFDLNERSLCLRKRRFGEHRQSVVLLLSGLLVPNRVDGDCEAGPAVARDDVEAFDPTKDQWPEPEADERVVLDAEGQLVLSSPDLVTETIGILARKGAGKTHLGMVLAEEFLASPFDIPFVVLDPTGVWRGLAANVDGTPADHRIVVFGGAQGHFPLTPLEGKRLARVVVTMRPLPGIMDMSDFTPEEQHGFVADFVGELFMFNKEPLHIFVDEADAFAPQRLDKSSKHQKRSLSVIDTAVRRGRTRGLGFTLITQRAAVISKNVLSQIGCMFFLQMIAPNDLDTVETWLHGQIRSGERKEFRDNLSVLGRGVAYYMRGGEHFRFQRFNVRAKQTFDSSGTPRMGEQPRTMALALLSDEDRVAIVTCEHGGSASVAGTPAIEQEVLKFDAKPAGIATCDVPEDEGEPFVDTVVVSNDSREREPGEDDE